MCAHKGSDKVWCALIAVMLQGNYCCHLNPLWGCISLLWLLCDLVEVQNPRLMLSAPVTAERRVGSVDDGCYETPASLRMVSLVSSDAQNSISQRLRNGTAIVPSFSCPGQLPICISYINLGSSAVHTTLTQTAVYHLCKRHWRRHMMLTFISANILTI